MKRNINIDRKPLAKEEINATKDFRSLASKVGIARSVSPKPTGKSTGWFAGGIAAIAIAAGIYVGTKTDSEQLVQEPETLIAEVTDTVSKTIFVNPPIPEADISNESYYVDADNGGKIKHHTGTEVTIPEGAFMDEEGNIITGKVEVQYREFHNQTEILLSGIPMDYDSAGKEQVFESAGMMEIRGYQDGKRLKIVPDKNFRICMHSKNPDPKFNLYYLDEEKEEWSYEGKDSIDNPKTEQGSIKDEPIEENIAKVIDKEEAQTEIADAEEVVAVIKKEIKTLKKESPRKPLKANPKKKNFTIDVKKTEFPELVVYAGTIFEVVDKSDLPEDTYSLTWNGVELLEKNNSYIVQLKKGERKEEIKVIPVLDGKDYDEAKKEFDSSFTDYSKKLTAKKEEEKQAEVNLSKIKARYKKEQEAYERRVAIMRSKMEFQAAARDELKRIFNINRFGTWNCDSPIPYPKGMLVLTNYEDEETGETIEFTKLDLVEKTRNACFPLDALRIGRLPFNPKRDNLLWGITLDGMIAVADTEDFKEIEKGQEAHTFKMKVVDIKGKTTSEIREIIGG
ncbi:hypothetical protein N9488_01210 [Flavobacteriales bacterium]|nr:hypothetical protein [Flavobacteriales bacterium]